MKTLENDVIVVDLQRCTGCWTCSLACKVGNDLPDDVFWLTVRTLGSGEGIDRPAGTWPNLRMSWIPLWSKRCIKCGSRTSAGELPYCVNACPNGALSYSGDAERAADELHERGLHLFELPAWEGTKNAVVYAERV